MAFPVRKVAVVAVLGLAALCGCGGGGGGGGSGGGDDLSLLDQEFTVATMTCNASFSGTEQAMSFTAGRTGTLVRIDLFLVTGGTTSDNDIQVELRPMFEGAPDPEGAFLVTGMSSNDLPTDDFGFVSVDLSAAGLQVEAGVEYAIVLRALLPTTGGNWGGSSDATEYAGGDGFTRNLALSDEFFANGCDFAFRTHVE